MADHPSRSDEQRQAGAALVEALATYLGIPLQDKLLELDGCSAQVDGYSEEPPVLCEAWAHVGKPKGSQPDKVMSDALKLLFCEGRLQRKFRKILLFSDESAQQYFTGGSWMAECLRAHEIETITLQLPSGLKAEVENAQRRQRR